MASFIVVLVLILMVGAAIRYLYNAKKSGVCVGCGNGKCSHGCSHCGGDQKEIEKLKEIRAAKAAAEKEQR